MRILRPVLVVLFVLCVSTLTLAWSPGTHAYIANKLNKGIAPANTMFGAVAPDINQVLSSDQNSTFFSATHYGFAGMWDATAVVHGRNAKALAFGFVSHNEAWGADHYAHIASNLYPNYINTDHRYPGQNGYVWVKAQQLCAVMQSQLQQSGQASPLTDILLSDPMNCHFIVEYAMDIVLKSTRDTKIGVQLMNAATTYDSDSLGLLFTNGYSGPAGGAMATYQGNWAGLIYMYGTALNKPTLRETVPAVAAFLEMLAEQLLGAQIDAALGVPSGTPLPDAVKQQLLAVINLGLQDSIALCAVDYNLELDATINAVRKNMKQHDMKPTF
jgi:hypothetical protein